MAKKIKIGKPNNKKELYENLIANQGQKAPIDLDKYFGKINFDISGLEYQLKVRDEWS